MKVVSDTSPIYYLLRIGCIDILPDLFGQVLIPHAVREELIHPGAGHEIGRWVSRPPSWLALIAVTETEFTDLQRLHRGERDAILLAEHVQADLLILDDRRARQAAQERQRPITGLLGILDQAAASRLIDLPEVISKLRETGFRIEPKLLKALLDRHQT